MMMLKEIRTRKNLTQEQLAELSGVDQSTICALEKNPNKRPAWDTVFKLSRALEIPPDILFPVDSSSAA